MPQADWIDPLLLGLRHWGAGKPDAAIISLDRCLDSLRDQPQTELWQVLVHSCLANIHLQAGYFDMSQEAQHSARELWSEQLFEGRWQDIGPHMSWFEGHLRSAGVLEQADLLSASCAQQVSIFLGHDRVSFSRPEVTQADASASDGSNSQMPVVSPKQERKIAPDRWKYHARSALSNGQLGRHKEMSDELLEARTIGVHVRPQDHGLRLFWTSWMECLCYFLAAEYSLSDRARQECKEMWLGLALQSGLESQSPTVEVCAILKEFGYHQIAQRILRELPEGQPPILDPWNDLKVEFQTLEENTESVLQQWREVVTACCRGLHEGVFRDLENGIARMKARLESDGRPGKSEAGKTKLGLLLLDHLLSVVGQRQGKHSFAATLFANTSRSWQEVPVPQRTQGPWARVYVNTAFENGCPWLVDSFPGQLYDPGQQSHGMVTLDPASTRQAPAANWETSLSQAWTMARQGKYDHALRATAIAEQSARKDPENTGLARAFIANSEAAIYFLQGSYPDCHAAYRESCQWWQREASKVDEEDIVGRFLSLLAAAGWPNLVEALELKIGAQLPVLLDPDTDLQEIQMGRWQESKSVEEPELPEMSTRQAHPGGGGWLSSLKGLLGRRRRLDD